MSNYFEIDPKDGGGEARVIGGAWEPLVSRPTFLDAVFPDALMIPQDQWQPTTLKAHCPPIKDQDGLGACNCFASVTALEICRAMKGLPYVELSPGDLYRRISGGADRGSLPEDALRTLADQGVCTAANTPPLDWRGENPGAKAEYPRFRILEALWCPTAAHAASAIQQGFALNVSVWWYGNDPMDADGWLRVSGSGGRGGHSICGVGLVNRNGGWGFQIQNSWSKQWGQQGFGVLPFARVESGAEVFQLWAVRECVQESLDFPSPKEN